MYNNFPYAPNTKKMFYKKSFFKKMFSANSVKIQKHFPLKLTELFFFFFFWKKKLVEISLRNIKLKEFNNIFR